MLTQFQQPNQSPAPHTTNAFLPTCNTQAPSDFVTSLEAITQHMTEAENPVLEELIRRDVHSMHAERNRLLDAIRDVNTPWYKLVKTARTMVFNLMGWDNNIDPDRTFVEKHQATHAVISAFNNRYSFIKVSTFEHDVSQIEKAYLQDISVDGVNLNLEDAVYSDPKARGMLENFEYTKGKRMHVIPEHVKAKQAAKEAESLGNNNPTKKVSLRNPL